MQRFSPKLAPVFESEINAFSVAATLKRINKLVSRLSILKVTPHMHINIKGKKCRQVPKNVSFLN